MHVSDGTALFVANLPAGGDAFTRALAALRQSIRMPAERQHRGALEAALRPVRRLQLTDPHGAVARGAADRLVSARNDAARLAGQLHLRMSIEQPEGPAEQLILHARKAVRGMNLAQHLCRGIARPVDRPLGFIADC